MHELNRKQNLIWALIVLLFPLMLVNAATFTVNKTTDENDGMCNGAHCTLREAMEASNAPGDDVIEFQTIFPFNTPVSITLILGELTVNNSGTLTINGPGKNILTISGNDTNRLFIINPNANFILNDVTLTNGNAGANIGGAIASVNANLQINRSVIKDSSADQGGGIFATGGSINIRNTEIDNNVANVGGGIYVAANTIIYASTISNNISNGVGGGVFSGGFETIFDISTVSGNTGAGGGGIRLDSGTLRLFDSTIAGNTATGSGGGIEVEAGANAFSTNTIIADNNASSPGNAPSKDFDGILNSQGFNLIEDTNETVIIGTTTGNILGQDPLLIDLADNGGFTKTHSLNLLSPAIDTGNSPIIPPVDQRGILRGRDGNQDGSFVDDIGSFELIPPYFVNTTDDTNDDICDSHCSLREAIAQANNFQTEDVIEFSSTLFDTLQTITLTLGELSVSNGRVLTINGKGKDLLTISGNSAGRIFRLNSGSTLTLNDITAANGNGFNNDGGAVFSDQATLNINNSVIKDSSTSSRGGAIFSNSGSFLNINNSTIDNNTALSGNFGGGIFTQAETKISNSTISNNNANGFGGGILGDTPLLEITNSTISGNTAFRGGGIYQNSGVVNTLNITCAENTSTDSGGGIVIFGTFSIRNTLVANNSAASAPDVSGVINTNGYNLIEDTSGTFINGDTTLDILGTDPLLGDLEDNGGLTKTHKLLENSPAIDQGGVAEFLPLSGKLLNFNRKTGGESPGFLQPLTTDQRGIPRPQDLSVPNPLGGFGDDIGAFEALAPTAALVDIYGKVLSSGGHGIYKALVQMTEQNGRVRIVLTNQFGYFIYKDIEVGQTVTFEIMTKQFEFDTQIVTVNKPLNSLIFMANKPNYGFKRERIWGNGIAFLK